MPDETSFKGAVRNKITVETLFKELNECLYRESKVKTASESVDAVTQQSGCGRKLFGDPIVLGFIPEAGSQTDFRGAVRSLLSCALWKQSS